MALNVDVFEFHDTESPDMKQQSPISPIESESSSGISSLDSDDLKVRNGQLLSWLTQEPVKCN